MEKKFAEIINEGKKNGKKLSEINAELKAAGATFHLDYTMTSDGPQVGWSEKEMAEGFIPAEEEPKDAQRTVDMRRPSRSCPDPSRSSGFPAASSRLPMTRTVMPKAR